MNKYLILLILALTGPVSAQDLTKTELCAKVSTIAESAAEARYLGIPMRQMMEIAQKHDTKGLAEVIVLDAYDLPNHHTENAQNHAIREFGNRIFSICFKAVEPGTAL